MLFLFVWKFSLSSCNITVFLIDNLDELLLFVFYFVAKILLTSFRSGVIPPPLCGCTLQVASPVNSILFAPCKKVKSSYVTDEAYDNEISSNDFCAVLSDGSLILFTESPSTKDHVQLIACNLKDENATDLHHWLWFKKDTFLCCRTLGTVSYLVEISLDLCTGKMNIR